MSDDFEGMTEEEIDLATARTAYDKRQDARLSKLEAAVFGPKPPVTPTPPVPPPVPVPAPTPTPSGGMTVALVNESTVVSDAQVAAWAKAYEIQAAHVDGHWHTGPVTVIGPVKLAAVPADAIALVVLDNADQAGALGYHDVSPPTPDFPNGRPYGRNFAKTCLDNGVDPASCGSHEFVEILGDVLCNEWEPPTAASKGLQLARELGDPVETTSYSIDIGTQSVTVSDFVIPAYFGLVKPDMPILADGVGNIAASTGAFISHTGLTGTPGKPLPGGYQITRDPSTGAVSQVFANGEELPGDDYPAWRLDGKGFPAARTARRKEDA